MAISNNASSLRTGVCTSTTRPTAPYEGQVIYETDTDKVLVWNGSAWLYLSVPQTTAQGDYTLFTPTWNSGLTVGNGTQEFYYSQLNKMVHVYGSIKFGSTSAITGSPNMALPVSREDITLANVILGTATFEDSGTAAYGAYPLSTATNSVSFYQWQVSGSNIKDGGINSTTPFTWTTNDGITINLWYKAA